MTNLKITTPSGTFEIPDSGYLSSPGTVCPKTPLHIREMTETDIAKVLIEGDTATINGVKYKRVEEPKPKTLYYLIGNWWDNVFVVHNACNNETSIDYLVNDIEKWLSDEIEYEYGNGDYDKGWNDALCTIKGKLR